MSGEQSEEKSHPATRRKLEKAREKGQLAKSRDLVSVATLACAGLALWLLGPAMAAVFGELAAGGVDASLQPMGPGTRAIVSLSAKALLLTALPVMAAVIVGAIAANLAANKGVIVSLEPLKPKLSHLDPVAGLKRIFGKRSMVELFKALTKVLILGAAVTVLSLLALNALVRAPLCGADCLLPLTGRLTRDLIALALVILALFAVVDVFLQRMLFLDDMKMTKSELKQERRDQEGDPTIRSARKRLMKEAAQAGPMGLKAVTMVIFGPDALVGLRYERGKTPAPLLVLKAREGGAMQVLAAARADGKAIVEDPPLARRLLSAKMGAAVPKRDFERVARALLMSGALRR